MPITAVLGEQRGDEGKGRFVDMLAENHEIVARFNGGHKAGHTVVLPGNRVMKLNMMPSGIAHEHTTNIIGNGTYVDPVNLLSEIKKAKDMGLEVNPDRLLLSSGSHVILPHHISLDEVREAGDDYQGSTKRGIAQTGSSKYERVGLQTGMIATNLAGVMSVAREKLFTQRELREKAGLEQLDEEMILDEFQESALRIGKFITDTVIYLNGRLRENPSAKVLAEGAQAFWLDIDHGMYPYVTSSSASIGGVQTGLGVGPKHIERIIGVSKIIPSHVGGGPFVTELTEPKLLEQIHGDMTAVDAERGTTTGRIRRLGYLDLPMMKRANMVNTTEEIAITKLDWVQRFGKEVPICVGYKRGREFIDIAPSSAHELEQWEPIYITPQLWQEDISGVRDYDELPGEAKHIIEIIERYTKLPVTMIGVGPGREQVILRDETKPSTLACGA